MIELLGSFPNDAEVLVLDLVGAAGMAYYMDPHVCLEKPWNNENNPLCVIIEANADDVPRYD
jgi:hypothetical protein